MNEKPQSNKGLNEYRIAPQALDDFLDNHRYPPEIQDAINAIVRSREASQVNLAALGLDPNVIESARSTLSEARIQVSTGFTFQGNPKQIRALDYFMESLRKERSRDPDWDEWDEIVLKSKAWQRSPGLSKDEMQWRATLTHKQALPLLRRAAVMSGVTVSPWVAITQPVALPNTTSSPQSASPSERATQENPIFYVTRDGEICMVSDGQNTGKPVMPRVTTETGIESVEKYAQQLEAIKRHKQIPTGPWSARGLSQQAYRQIAAIRGIPTDSTYVEEQKTKAIAELHQLYI